MRLLRTKDMFHSGSFISLGWHDFSELLNILLMMLLASKVCASQIEDMIKGIPIALYCRNGKLQLLTQILKELSVIC